MNEKEVNKSKSLTSGGIVGLVFFAVQLIASGVLLFNIVRLNMIPTKYVAAVAVVLLLLVAVNAFFLIKKNKNRILRVIGILLAVIITAGSIYGSSMLGDVNSLIRNITDANGKISAMMGVYVRTDDPAESIEDTAKYLYGTMAGLDDENTAKAKANLETVLDTELNVTEYASITVVVDSLLDQQVNAILMNESYIDTLMDTEEYAELDSQIRLLYEVPIVVEASDDTEEEESTAVEDITTTPFVVYISGSDTRSKILDTSRSDVNILMAVNPETKQILLLNTPRDYYVGNPAGGGSMDKLTHCGIYGVNNSIAALENLYDTEINYYGQINFTGFETLIDAIGGITVTSPQAFTAADGDTFTAGENYVNGSQALAFARERHAFASGDNQRGKNQMEVITSVIEKVTSSTTFLTNYGEILGSLENMFVTDLSADEIGSLVRMQLNDMSGWTVNSYAVTGSGGKATTYSMPNFYAYVMYQDAGMVEQAKTLLDKIENGEAITESDVQ